VTNLCAVLALTFVELHGPSGQVLELNPSEVSSIRAPIDVGSGHWAKGTKCIVVMTNGRLNAVVEDCATVIQKLK